MKREGVRIYRVVRLSIIIVWILVMGVLIQRTYFNASESYINTNRSAHQLRPREEWMGIYWGKDKVGYSVSKIKKALNFGERTSGRKRVKNFEMNNVAEKIFNLYKRILSSS